MHLDFPANFLYSPQFLMSESSASEQADSGRTIIIQNHTRGSWLPWLLVLGLLFALGISFMLHLVQLGSAIDVTQDEPAEKFLSGDESSSHKIARVALDFTIRPPFTERFMQTLQRVLDDDQVEGVLLVIDSPGGLVSDSHRIYDKLREINQKKPVYVAMRGICASGGYYIAMGAGPEGRIFAEPTTWTGSIGVIIPRYDVSGLASQYGVRSDSIVTGPFKDSLNPLKELTPPERELWQAIADEALDRFVRVIDEGRAMLDEAAVRKLATGQVFTADQALAHQMVDEIGYDEDALKSLKSKIGQASVKVVEYRFTPTLAESLLGASARTPHLDPLSKILESQTPRAMYLFGWESGVSGSR